MQDAQAINRQLVQTNRLLKLGYAGLAVAMLTGYVVAQGGNEPQQQSADQAPHVGLNTLGTSQMIVGVDYPDGFAVVVDENGQINVVHYDGTVIVPNRKVYSHVYQEERGPRRPRTEAP